MIGKLVNFYKTLYKDYVIDKLPIDVSISEKNITLTLHNAEKMRFQTVDETFVISPDNVAGILYDDLENDILIMFQEADIDIRSIKTQKNIRKTKQFNSAICFGLNEQTSLVDEFKKYNYPIEYLSEIENAEQEEYDPELLVNKLLRQTSPNNENKLNTEKTSTTQSIEKEA